MSKTVEEKRQEEIEFYKTLYKDHNYGRGKTIRRTVTNRVCKQWGKRADWKTWLDVGCGSHVIDVPSNIKKLVRVDPAWTDGVDHVLSIHELLDEFDPGQFDIVSSFDVLEHMLPEDLDDAIQIQWMLVKEGGRMIISVGTDVGGTWMGRSAHLTQEDAGWWVKKIRSVVGTDVSHVATAKKTSPFFVVNK